MKYKLNNKTTWKIATKIDAKYQQYLLFCNMAVCLWGNAIDLGVKATQNSAIKTRKIALVAIFVRFLPKIDNFMAIK